MPLDFASMWRTGEAKAPAMDVECRQGHVCRLTLTAPRPVLRLRLRLLLSGLGICVRAHLDGLANGERLRKKPHGQRGFDGAVVAGGCERGVDGKAAEDLEAIARRHLVEVALPEDLAYGRNPGR